MKKLLFTLLAVFAWVNVAFATININTATKAELEQIKGIGPVKAQAILDYRGKNGAFKTVDELDNVKGIGKATIDKIRGDITVSGASSSAPAKTSPAPAKPAAATPAPSVSKKEPAKADAGKDKKPSDKKDAAASKKKNAKDKADTQADDAKAKSKK